ncbi:hypothetical protein [Clavibacter michiganensis]|uniref:PIN-like domain-containing protein n=1 Tax=Clavibacter michiganensis TaxID=28447 RepID=UPI003EBB81D9
MAAPLTFFLDRGLGSRIIADGLREAGWVLETMDERYGRQRSQKLRDEHWIREASDAGDVILCKDSRIAWNRLEAEAVLYNGARLFALSSSNATGPQMLQMLLDSERRIFAQASSSRRGYVCAVTGKGLREVPLSL